MTILHIIDNLGVGGTESAMATLIERTGNEVCHAVCSVRGSGPIRQRLEERGVPVISLAKQPGRDWRLALRLAGICRTIAPDIVHTRNWGTIDGIVAARLACVPVVIHGEHGRHADDPDGTNRRRNRLRRLLAPFVDRVVAVSHDLREWLVRDVRLRSDKVVTIQNGVDTNRFRPSAHRDDLRRQYGYGTEEILVGTVGRLDPVKNHASLLEAIAPLLSRHPSLRLVVIGNGPERHALEAAARRMGATNIVRIAGHSDDIPGWLSAMDIFVLPSIAEGMCNTVLEAMAAGLPVVATQVGGNPEMVADGVNGLLIQPSEAGELARAIESYVSDESLRRTHGTAGRERVEQFFSLERTIGSYLDLYTASLGSLRQSAGKEARFVQ